MKKVFLIFAMIFIVAPAVSNACPIQRQIIRQRQFFPARAALRFVAPPFRQQRVIIRQNFVNPQSFFVPRVQQFRGFQQRQFQNAGCLIY